jgi:signal transduction histidine kinase
MSVALSNPPQVRNIQGWVSGGTDRVALIDSNGTIVAVNESWSSGAMRSGASIRDVGPGVNYIEVCRRASASCNDAREALQGIRSVLRGKSSSFVMDYTAEWVSGPAHFRMVVTPFCHGNAQAAIIHIDITELYLSKQKSLNRVREFARRLVNAQEDERERIAKEMHDDLGNRVALLSFSVQGLIKRRRVQGLPANELSDVLNKITELSRTLSQLSHCLHPHLLKDCGIGGALKELCDEFARSTSIPIASTIPEEFLQISEESGLCLFRVTQECLHNIAKHSEAARATVVLERMPNHVRLIVADNGCGFVPSVAWKKAGLGLTSMKERVLCVRGQLEIRSSPGTGTEVRVTIPVPESAHSSTH